MPALLAVMANSGAHTWMEFVSVSSTGLSNAQFELIHVSYTVSDVKWIGLTLLTTVCEPKIVVFCVDITLIDLAGIALVKHTAVDTDVSAQQVPFPGSTEHVIEMIGETPSARKSLPDKLESNTG